MCTWYAGGRTHSSAKCVCIVTVKMPATIYDYLLRKCLGKYSAAKGLLGLRHGKINPCADKSLEQTFLILRSSLIVASSVPLAKFLLL